MKKNQIKLLILSLLTYICIYSTPAYAGTVDDLRTLLDLSKEKTEFTTEETNEIIYQYNKAESSNKYVKLFKINDDINAMDQVDLETKKKNMNTSIQYLESDLVHVYSTYGEADKVLELKTNLDVLNFEKNQSLKASPYVKFDVPKTDNPWAKKYAQVKNQLKNTTTGKDIGDVIVKKSPVNSSLNITSLYGIRTHPIAKEDLMHYGVDLTASLNSTVVALWNGTVSRIYYDKTGGNIIEITHDSGLKTRYLHLSRSLVKEGQTVKQYSAIAYSGDTGVVTGPHLHLEVSIDGSTVDPLLVFGQLGVDALESYKKQLQLRTDIDNSDTIQQINNTIFKIKTVEETKPTTSSSSNSEDKTTSTDNNNSDVVDLALPKDYTKPNPSTN